MSAYKATLRTSGRRSLVTRGGDVLRAEVGPVSKNLLAVERALPRAAEQLQAHQECVGLLQTINSATDSIRIMSFCIDHPKIDEALCAKLKAGVAVEVIVSLGEDEKFCWEKFKQLRIVSAQCDYRVVRGKVAPSVPGVEDHRRVHVSDMQNKNIIVDQNHGGVMCLHADHSWC